MDAKAKKGATESVEKVKECGKSNQEIDRNS